MCSPELPGTLSPDAVLAAVDAVISEKVDVEGAGVIVRENGVVELEFALRETEVLKDVDELRETEELREANELRETDEMDELPEADELREAEELAEPDLTVERVEPGETTVTVCVTVIAEHC